LNDYLVFCGRFGTIKISFVMIHTEYLSNLSARSYVCFFIFFHSTFDVHFFPLLFSFKHRFSLLHKSRNRLDNIL
jgi:hypothetical protein